MWSRAARSRRSGCASLVNQHQGLRGEIRAPRATAESAWIHEGNDFGGVRERPGHDAGPGPPKQGGAAEGREMKKVSGESPLTF